MTNLPRITLREWPAPPTGTIGTLDTIAADRADALRALLPDLAGECWPVVTRLCAWVASRWEHDGWHDVEGLDALELLERANGGERFSCVDYGIVLAQALNALGLPARRVHALRSGYDLPRTGMGHVVVEAWTADMGKWVVIDGQNHAFWRDDDRGKPLSALELWQRYRSGATAPQFVDVDGTQRDDADEWWQHFAGVGVGDIGLAGDGFPLIFQGRHMLHRERILTDPAGCYPDLAAITPGCTWASDGVPGLRLTPVHPYAQAVQVDGVDLAAGSVVPLGLEPGDHVMSIRTVTTHGLAATQRIRYEVRLNPAG